MTQVHEKLRGFLELLPLLEAVCEPALQERHWDALATVTGIDVSSDRICSMRWLIDNGMLESRAGVIEIAGAARKVLHRRAARMHDLRRSRSHCTSCARARRVQRNTCQ